MKWRCLCVRTSSSGRLQITRYALWPIPMVLCCQSLAVGSVERCCALGIWEGARLKFHRPAESLWEKKMEKPSGLEPGVQERRSLEQVKGPGGAGVGPPATCLGQPLLLPSGYLFLAEKFRSSTLPEKDWINLKYCGNQFIPFLYTNNPICIEFYF